MRSSPLRKVLLTLRVRPSRHNNLTRSVRSTIGKALTVGLLAGLIAAASGLPAAADGGKLKWLPQRPDQAADTVTAAGHVAQSTQAAALQPAPMRMAQQSAPNAFKDPFGDKKRTPVPAARIGDDLLQKEPVEPKPGSSLPGLTPEEPAAPKDLFAPPASETQKKTEAKQPLLEQELAAKQHEFKEGCPTIKDLKKIGELTTSLTPEEGDLPQDCPLGKNAVFQPRNWAPITYAWTASGLCHKPLYFEDVQLERYGHMAGPWLQPFASGAHFFLTIPILPYKMGLEPPNECIYALGYYRPGDCAPYMLDPIPLSVRAALFEAGALTGAACVIP